MYTWTQLNEQGEHNAACRDRVRDSGVFSGHWTVVRDINDKRVRDDEDDDPGAGQSPRVGEPSSSSKRLLKRNNPELVDSEARSKRIRVGEKTLLKRKFSEAMPENTELAVPDSLAGSSGAAVTNLVGLVHLTESTIQRHLQTGITHILSTTVSTRCQCWFCVSSTLVRLLFLLRFFAHVF